MSTLQPLSTPWTSLIFKGKTNILIVTDDLDERGPLQAARPDRRRDPVAASRCGTRLTDRHKYPSKPLSGTHSWPSALSTS